MQFVHLSQGEQNFLPCGKLQALPFRKSAFYYVAMLICIQLIVQLGKRKKALKPHAEILEDILWRDLLCGAILEYTSNSMFVSAFE